MSRFGRHAAVPETGGSGTEVQIPFDTFELSGELVLPGQAAGVVLFAHGSGSSRHSPRNQFVARVLREHGVGTLLFDLLTGAEEQEDRLTGHLRFDIGLLGRRLQQVTRWYHEKDSARLLGYFGASTGAAAALVAAAESQALPLRAIVSRGGRPDLAGAALVAVKAPTLLLVGGDDVPVIGLNEQALAQMRCPRQLRIIPGASHLFEEAGTLEQVSELASEWFEQHFGPQRE